MIVLGSFYTKDNFGNDQTMTSIQIIKYTSFLINQYFVKHFCNQPPDSQTFIIQVKKNQKMAREDEFERKTTFNKSGKSIYIILVQQGVHIYHLVFHITPAQGSRRSRIMLESGDNKNVMAVKNSKNN